MNPDEKYLNLAQLARHGGIIAFHDIVVHPKYPDVQVYRLWNDLKTKYVHFELIDTSDEGDNGPWGGIGVILV